MSWRAVDIDDRYKTASYPIVFVLYRCDSCGRKACSKLGESPSACCCGARR